MNGVHRSGAERAWGSGRARSVQRRETPYGLEPVTSRPRASDPHTPRPKHPKKLDQQSGFGPWGVPVVQTTRPAHTVTGCTLADSERENQKYLISRSRLYHRRTGRTGCQVESLCSGDPRVPDDQRREPERRLPQRKESEATVGKWRQLSRDACAPGPPSPPTIRAASNCSAHSEGRLPFLDGR